MTVAITPATTAAIRRARKVHAISMNETPMGPVVQDSRKARLADLRHRDSAAASSSSPAQSPTSSSTKPLQAHLWITAAVVNPAQAVVAPQPEATTPPPPPPLYHWYAPQLAVDEFREDMLKWSEDMRKWRVNVASDKPPPPSPPTIAHNFAFRCATHVDDVIREPGGKCVKLVSRLELVPEFDPSSHQGGKRPLVIEDTVVSDAPFACAIEDRIEESRDRLVRIAIASIVRGEFYRLYAGEVSTNECAEHWRKHHDYLMTEFARYTYNREKARQNEARAREGKTLMCRTVEPMWVKPEELSRVSDAMFARCYEWTTRSTSCDVLSMNRDDFQDRRSTACWKRLQAEQAEVNRRYAQRRQQQQQQQQQRDTVKQEAS
jgi:hypothetical protein